MPYRTILSISKTASEAAFTLPHALAIAAHFKAHLEGIAIVQTLRPVFWDGDQTAPQSVLEESGQIAKDIETKTRDSASHAGVELSWQTLRAPESGAVKMLVNHARTVDLVVTNAEPGYAAYVSAAQPLEALILESGRPVLIVPRKAPNVVGVPVLVGWSDSKASAQAVFGALPLLKAAPSVTLACISDDHDKVSHPLNSRAHLVHTLERHGVKVSVLGAASNHKRSGEHLFDLAESNGCGLVVMGGYGHSKFHEAILGGATRYALENMRLPTLFAH